MFKRQESITIIRKWFPFPVSVESFAMNEDAKTATYEYALRDGAEHERVKAFRKFRISWIFALESGGRTPAYYVDRLRRSNNNLPWVFFHPVFGAYTCIIASMEINESGEDNEAVGTDDTIYTNYRFSIEFRESTDPSAARNATRTSRLYPAVNVRPPSNFYSQTLTYRTCTELYQAIVEGRIAPWTNPVANAERLRYPLDMRQCAYNRWLANPNGESTTTLTTWNQRYYTVVPWDRWLKIARRFNIPFTSLFAVNQWRNVRTRPRTNQWLRWIDPNKLRPWDLLIIPSQ